MGTDKTGYVYVLQMEGHPYYKIGRTVNMSRRIGQIKPQMPGKLRVIMAHRVDDTHHAEALLHEEFGNRRLNGEWFHLNDDCLKLVRLGLLHFQSSWLLKRLIQTMPQSTEYVDFDWIEKIAKVTSRAARRASRRQALILLASYQHKTSESEQAVIAKTDSVLNAEIVG